MQQWQTYMQHISLKINSENQQHIIICQKYWALNDKRKFINTVPNICDQFQLSQDEILDIIRKCAVVTDLKIKCHICHQPKKYLTHYEYNIPRIKLPSPYKCKNCLNDIQNKILQDFNQIKSSIPLALSEIGYEQAIYIYTALEILQSYSPKYRTFEEIQIIHPLYILNDHVIFKTILEAAYAAKYIVPLSLDDFELLKQAAFYNDKIIYVNWQANTNSGSMDQLQYEIKALFLDHSRTTYRTQHNDLCYEIAYLECIQCLNHVLKKHKITYKPSHGTRLIIHKGLSRLSVAQISHLLYQSVAQSKHKHLLTPEQQTLPKGQLAITLLDQKITEYLKNPYHIKDYHRLQHTPQSYLSYVLFDKVFQKSDCGFYEALHKLLL